MTFYGKDPEPRVSAEVKRFHYLMPGTTTATSVKAQHVYFYESGHVGFWNESEDGARTLVLAVKALDVWEDEE